MLDRFTALAHLLGMLVEPLLDGLEKVFVFPAGDPVLLARGATMLDGAALAGSWPSSGARSALFSWFVNRDRPNVRRQGHR